MKNLLNGILLYSLSYLMFSGISVANDDSEVIESEEARFARLVKEYPFEIFNGDWCGKWDYIFNVCLDVRYDPASGEYTAVYRWEEELGKPYESMELKGRRTNLNTVVFNGFIIMSVFKPKSAEQQNTARVLGLFEERSRLAIMDLTDGINR